MPARLQSVPGTAFFMSQTFQATPYSDCFDNSVLWDYRYSYEFRSFHNYTSDEFTFEKGMWPNRTSFVSDPEVPCSLMLDRDSNAFGNASIYSSWYFGYGGSQTTKFIMGQCKRVDSTPIGGAVVQCFRTSDDMFVSETATDDNGRFECKCPNTPTDTHYLVAYYDSATDLAGTTVNTLVPTRRDGSV